MNSSFLHAQDEIDADKRALRLLLDSFHLEQEALLEETINDPHTRSRIGKCIGFAFVRPYSGER